MKQLTQEKVIEEIIKGKFLSNFPTYKDNKSVVLEAVKHYGWTLEYASERLRDDKEVVLEAVRRVGGSLNYASKRLRDDKEVVLEAVKCMGYSLLYASERLKDDKEIVLEAIRQKGWNLSFASDRLKEELLPQVLIYLGYEGSVEPMEIVKYKGKFLCLLKTEDQNNKEIVLEAIKQRKFYLVYASQEIKDRIGNNDPIQFLGQWIKKEKAKELDSQLDKKENVGKIKI